MLKQEKLKDLLREGKTALDEKKYEEAIEKFEQMTKLDEENPETSYYLALAFIHRKDDASAISHLKQVIDSGYNYLYTQQCHMILGFIYSRQERYGDAEKEIRRVVDAGIQSAPAFSALGHVLFKIGRTDEAIERLEKAVSIAPDNANAHNSLGFVLADSGRDTEKAVRECRIAVKMNPENAAYHDSLGWALYKNGNADDAMESIDKALELNPGHAEIKRHRATIK